MQPRTAIALVHASVLLALGCASGTPSAASRKEDCVNVELDPCPPACEASAEELQGKPCPGVATRMMIVSCATPTHFCSCQGKWYCFEPEPRDDDCDLICR
ncbi:MAG: hypothetical protein KC766_16830 [Myxococcales bacterium]|nr:hypothetical protein [Myxococcales bacterium]